MTALVLGATGTAGSGILRACLASPDVTSVRVLVRRPLALSHDKLRVVLHDDYLHFDAVHDAFAGVDACFYALGRSVGQVSGEPEYRRVTHDFALVAAATLASASPRAVLHFISGRSTSLDSRFMWARVKAETERDLRGAVSTVCWRPGFIDGDSSGGPAYLQALRPVFRLLKPVRSLYVSGEDIGWAMIQATRAGRREGTLENPEIRDLADSARGH